MKKMPPRCTGFLMALCLATATALASPPQTAAPEWELREATVLHLSFNQSSAAQNRLENPAGEAQALFLHEEEELSIADAQTTPLLGGALYFDGENTAIRVGPHPSLEFRESFSLSFWSLMPDPGESGTLLSHGDFALERQSWYCVWRGDLRQWLLAVGQGKNLSAQYAFPTPIEPQRYHHICAAFDSRAPAGEQWRLYFDGRAVDPVEIKVDRPLAALPQKELPVLVGAGNSDGFLVNHYHGALDELRLINRAITPDEAFSLYTKGKESEALGIPSPKASE